MNVDVTVYETATGKVTRVCNVPSEDAAAQVKAGEAYIVGWYASHWIDTGTTPPAAVERVALPAPSKTTITGNGTDKATWSPLPNPTTVTITGDDSATLTVTDGTFDYTLDGAGEVSVRLDAGPRYIVREDRIHAT